MQLINWYASEKPARDYAEKHLGLIPAEFVVLPAKSKGFDVYLTDECQHPWFVRKPDAPVPEMKRNGVARPRRDGDTGAVWFYCDEWLKMTGTIPARGHTMEDMQGLGINPHTVATQYKLWRKFHGITGRVAKAA